MDTYRLERELIDDEGWRSKAYKCTGKDLHKPDDGESWTIGVGHKLAAHEIVDPVETMEWTSEQIFTALAQDIQLAIRGCEMIFGRSRFQRMTEKRQRALANMCFQLGTGGLSGFRRMIAAIFADDWTQASCEALNSKWAKQTPKRARRVAKMLLEG